MDQQFAALVESLAPKLQRLIAMPPLKNGASRAAMPKKGVYLFTDGGVHLYVGRSDNLASRYGRHCNPGATHRMASFAFQLARKETGKTIPAYKTGESSRVGLIADPIFKAAFVKAKERIRGMKYRYVEETVQTGRRCSKCIALSS